MALSLTHRRFLPLAGLILLSGCFLQNHLEHLKEVNPAASDFSSSLAAEYLAYAESEAELGHPIHADYFASKGLKAAKKEMVEPDMPDGNLPALVQEELKASRQYLMTLLNDDMKHVSPQQAARAQLVYDCWAHQQARHPDKESVSCAEEFKSAIAELETVAESFAYTKEMKRVLKFRGRETRLNDRARQEVDHIAQQVSSLQQFEIELKAVPGSPGEAFVEIARKRADLVRKALVEKGIPPEYVDIQDIEASEAVYLSHDNEDAPRNSVMVTVKAISSGTEEEQ